MELTPPPVRMRPLEPDPLRVDIINGWPHSTVVATVVTIILLFLLLLHVLSLLLLKQSLLTCGH